MQALAVAVKRARLPQEAHCHVGRQGVNPLHGRVVPAQSVFQVRPLVPLLAGEVERDAPLTRVAQRRNPRQRNGQRDQRLDDEAEVNRFGRQPFQPAQGQRRHNRQRPEHVQHQPRLQADVRAERRADQPRRQDHPRHHARHSQPGSLGRSQPPARQRQQWDQQQEQRANVRPVSPRPLHAEHSRRQRQQRNLPGTLAVDQAGARLAVPVLADGVHLR